MAITFPTVFQSAIATNAADTAAGRLTPTRYNQGCSVAGLSATSGAVLFSTDATTLAQSTGLLWNTSGAAGEGLAIAAGTAITDVAAFSLTRTNNNAAVATGVKWTFTDTSSAAGFLPFKILGGAAGTTNLFSISKAGEIVIPQSTTAGITLGSGTNAWSMFQAFNQSVYFGANHGTQIAMDPSGVYVLSTGRYNFSSSSSDAFATQSNISQISAGLLGIGTTGAGFAGRLKLTSMITAAVAVGSLNASPTIGEVQTVNDALAVTAKGATVSAGGSAVCQVMWNGSNWVGT